MDRYAALARNAGIVSTDLKTASLPVAAGPAVASGLLVDIVVLSHDVDFFESTRAAIGERNPVWRARSAEEAAELLLTARCGVLLVDMSAVSSSADALIVQIVEQFPDVVICVAGSREDEPLLVPLIGAGLVYRFMHKPVTARRAGMFLQAAIRHHVEKRDSLPRDQVMPALRRLARPPASLKWIYVGTLLVAVAIVAGYLLPARPPHETQPAATAPMQVQAVAPLANPVLSRARAAFAAGRYEAPAGRNALDLYQAVLLEQPGHAEARAGFERTVAHVLRQARTQAAAGERDEADRLVQRVLAVAPQRDDAVALALELNPPETPSSHLAEEQVAAARLAAEIAQDAADRALEKSLAAAQQAAAERQAAVAPSAPAQPDAGKTRTTPVTQATPAVPATPASRLSAPKPTPVQPARVTPDPLAPRFTNAPAGGYGAVLAGKRPTQSHGTPTVSKPVIAGPTPDAGRASHAAATPAPARAPVTPASHVAAKAPVAAIAGLAVPAPDVAPSVVADLRTAVADELDRIEWQDPVYPREALRNRTRGRVQLEFTITPAGTVRDVVVVDAEPSGVFDRAATDALAKWRFKPRFVDGQPVVQRSSLTMRFDVDD